MLLTPRSHSGDNQMLGLMACWSQTGRVTIWTSCRLMRDVRNAVERLVGFSRLGIRRGQIELVISVL